MTNSKQIDHLERQAVRKAEIAEAKKTDAIVQLAYFKYIRDMVENDGTTDATRKSYNEMMKFYNDRIEDLEMDASGQTRYNYILTWTDDTSSDTSTNIFKTAKQVNEYITEFIQSEDIREAYLYDDAQDYNVPTAEEIDEMVNKIRYSIPFELCKFGDEDEMCITFTLKHVVVN